MKQSNLRTEFISVFKLTYENFLDAMIKLNYTVGSIESDKLLLDRIVNLYPSNYIFTDKQHDMFMLTTNKAYKIFLSISNAKYAVENSISEGHTPDYSTVAHAFTPAEFNACTDYTQKYMVCDHTAGSVFTMYATCEEDLIYKLDNHTNCSWMVILNSFQPKLDIQHKDI